MASFYKGEKITADKLNQVANSKDELHYSIEDSGRTIGPYYMPPSGYFRIRLEGQVWPTIGSSASEIDWTLYRLENSNWVTVNTGHASSQLYNTQDFTRRASDYGGEGWYRLYIVHRRNHEDNLNMDDADLEVYVFPWRNNSVKGDPLYYFDSPDNSGNTIGGQLLTVDLVNSGLVGTKPKT